MLIAVLSGILFALLFLFFRLQNGWLRFIPAFLPLSLLIYFSTWLPEVAAGKEILFKYTWIPAMGVNLDFKLDGLAMLFSLMITGIGTLVYIYAAAYLSDRSQIHKFFSCLSLFMAAMLGLVLSDNLLVLFIFWELTSISSFFLIGWNTKEEASRKSAVLALAITGGGGFLLLAGVLLMGNVGGSYSIQALTAASATLKQHGSYVLMLCFVFAGAFTKSAMFPFHFWLPGAMKAPTPVSAYLHSATMVKAGIYLLFRLSPVLGGEPLWNYTLMIVGGFTLLYAAFQSLFRTDLKGVLAYSTIAALGLIVLLIGIGTTESFLAAAVFILVHALYKAALFLCTGIIDHAVHSRDLTKLSGLRKIMMPVAIAAGIAALSSAGIPFTFGFIGKDLIYEATMQTGMLAIQLTGLVLIANVLLSYAGYVAGFRPFTGALPEAYADTTKPEFLLWGPPVLLAVLSLLFGFFPALSSPLVNAVVANAGGNPALPDLKLWHGFNLILLLSGVTVLGGVVLYLLRKPADSQVQFMDRFESFSTRSFFLRLAEGIKQISHYFTHKLQNGYLRNYMITIISFLLILLCWKLVKLIPHSIDFSAMTPVSMYDVVILVMMVSAIFVLIFTSSRLTSIISLSIVGYSICLLFVFYGAPDLAMTQFTIDTLTAVLFMLILLKLPPFLTLTNKAIKIRDAIISTIFGGVISMIAFLVLQEPTHKTISRFYADNAYSLAKGKNVVNVILVDFRGSDTLIEITVLTIAALGVYSMLKLKISSSEKE
ncbi:hydrogen gas-evolving membrane-bound hydrogenase subunit E [Pedobacter antarcticus]|uniref:hydrogen gas-evolving membrane-bound hydrogenase subunit E n=1 Tax=Pedobacter antarcticus TaxID=34086 RepID=UPI001C57DAEB|nr:hydrogen gas-evolving membrane-bound hydrogenase subunit E [Pedobacter antarcticus]